jgi:hypothetical protein
MYFNSYKNKIKSSENQITRISTLRPLSVAFKIGSLKSSKKINGVVLSFNNSAGKILISRHLSEKYLLFNN